MSKKKVKCSFCGRDIVRRPINPNTKKPIKNFFCDKSCKGKWQTLQREKLGFDKKWLIDEYINKKKSANTIAKEIGRDPKRVWEWIVDYGIPTRPRGHNTDQLPKDGSTWLGRKHSKSTKQKLSKIAKEDGRLPWGKNNPHWLKTHPVEDHPKWKGGITADRQKVYSSEEWANSVKEVWKRDNATCQRCGKHHNTTTSRGTFNIHHIVSFMVKEKRTDVSNLVLLCKECHKFVHSNKNIEKHFLKDK